MAIQKFHEFSNTTSYYTGQGCLVCGTNVGVCIDLGITDQIDGVIALCEDHARECGVLVGLVANTESDRYFAQSAWDSAEEILAVAQKEREQAAADREAVERLLGPIRADQAETPEELSQ